MQGIQTVNIKLYDYVESIPSMEVCSQLLTSYFDMSVCVCVSYIKANQIKFAFVA